MNFKMMLTLTTLTTALVACAKTSSGTSAASASSVLTLAPMSSSVAPGGTTTVLVTGGTGVYVNAGAVQGRLTQASVNSYLYTAPTSLTLGSTDTLTVSDSSGTVGTVVILLNGAAQSSTATGAAPFTNTSCQGMYTLNINGVSAAVSVYQNVSNQISGYMLINNYYYPINGSCSVVPGQTSGTLSFVNLIMNQTYSAAVTSSGGRLVLTGNVQTSAATYNFTGTSNGITAAPVAETLACDGTYSAMIGQNAGQLRLINNGTGQVGGYLVLQGYFYAFTGTCAQAVSLQNLTNGSNYTGNATFNGPSVAINGSFTTRDGAVLAWSANK